MRNRYVAEWKYNQNQLTNEKYAEYTAMTRDTCTRVGSKVTKKQAKAARKNPAQTRLRLAPVRGKMYVMKECILADLYEGKAVIYRKRKLRAKTVLKWPVEKLVEELNLGALFRISEV